MTYKGLEESTLVLLLLAAQRAVLDNGGDGWAVIISPSYTELADLYGSLAGAVFRSREDRENYVAFYNSQEGISFVSSLPPANREWYEVVLELP